MDDEVEASIDFFIRLILKSIAGGFGGGVGLHLEHFELLPAKAFQSILEDFLPDLSMSGSPAVDVSLAT